MADPFNALTHGCLRQITDRVEVNQPVVQCVQIKPMNSQAGAERFRVVMSDSVNFMQGMLGIQLNPIIHDGQLKKGSICRLKSYQRNFIKNKNILVILDIDILQEFGEPEKLGQPVAIEEKAEDAEDVKPQPGNIGGDGFYGSKPQQVQPQQQQRSLPSRTNGASAASHGNNIFPIEALSPYAHKWTIKARCSHKGDVKTWHNKNGEGKLFSVNFLDDSGEIRATGFNDAVDSWYEVLQEGSVYYVSAPCKVQLAKKQYSNLNNDYELTFEKDTLIEKAEDTEGVPEVTFNFTSLADLQTVEKDNTIDCIGVLQDVGELSEITSKTSGKPFSKRELSLVDNTGFNVHLTVWGKTAQSFESQPESVLAFKGVKVSDFGGRSLSLLSSGSMTVDPDIDEAHKLKGWFDGGGRNDKFQSHQTTMAVAGATSGGSRDVYKTVAQIRDEGLGMNKEFDYFNIKGTIIYVKSENHAYPACQTEGCNKKVVESEPNQWRCEKCNTAWEKPSYRYTLSINVADHTGQIWVTCFNETGLQLMGVSADDLWQLKEDGDDARWRNAFADASCKTFVFRCKAKMDNYGDQQRVRYQVQYAKPLDFSAEAKKLADIIKQYDINSDGLFVT